MKNSLSLLFLILAACAPNKDAAIESSGRSVVVYGNRLQTGAASPSWRLYASYIADHFSLSFDDRTKLCDSQADIGAGNCFVGGQTSTIGALSSSDVIVGIFGFYEAMTYGSSATTQQQNEYKDGLRLFLTNAAASGAEVFIADIPYEDPALCGPCSAPWNHRSYADFDFYRNLTRQVVTELGLTNVHIVTNPRAEPMAYGSTWTDEAGKILIANDFINEIDGWLQ